MICLYMHKIVQTLVNNRKKLIVWSSFFVVGLIFLTIPSQLLAQGDAEVQVDAAGLPLLSFGELLTFIIRLFFVIAGIAALIYGLWGALTWITSGGGADEVKAAREKIQAAILGVFVLIVVLSIIVALEQLVFNKRLCFGLSCPVTIPGLLTFPMDCTGPTNCCAEMDMTGGSCAAPGTPARDESKAICSAPDTRKVRVPFGVDICVEDEWSYGVLCCTP